MASAAQALNGSIAIGVGEAKMLAASTMAAKGGGDAHHIATNKNGVSTARGGPWTPKFQAMFDKAGMSMDDADNIVQVLNHQGPHPEAYHQEVFNRLTAATRGLDGDAYGAAFRGALRTMGTELSTPGTLLNSLVTP